MSLLIKDRFSETTEVDKITQLVDKMSLIMEGANNFHLASTHSKEKEKVKNSLKIVNLVNSHNKCQGIYGERCIGGSLKRQIEMNGKERSSEDLKYLVQEVMFDSTTELQKELLMLIFYALSNLLGGIFYKSFVDGKKEEIVRCIKNYTNPNKVLEGDGLVESDRLVDINTSNEIGLNAIHPVCKDGHKHIHVDKPAKENDDHNDDDSKTFSDLRGAEFSHSNHECFHCHGRNGKEVDSGDPSSYLTSNSSSFELHLETVGPIPCHVTISNANDFSNLESLETIFDYPCIHEGKPSYLRRIQVGKLDKGSSLMACVEDAKQLECVANQEGEKECLKRATDDHEFQPGKEQTIQNILKEKLKKGLSGLQTITGINRARMWLEKCSWFRTEDSTLGGEDRKQNEVIVKTVPKLKADHTIRETLRKDSASSANKMKLSVVSPQSSSSSFLLSSSLSSMSILNYLSIFRFHSRITDEETSGEAADCGDPVDPEEDEGDPVDDEGDPVDPPIPIPQVIPVAEWDGHPVDPIGEAEGDGGDDPVDPAGNQVVIG